MRARACRVFSEGKRTGTTRSLAMSMQQSIPMLLRLPRFSMLCCAVLRCASFLPVLPLEEIYMARNTMDVPQGTGLEFHTDIHILGTLGNTRPREERKFVARRFRANPTRRSCPLSCVLFLFLPFFFSLSSCDAHCPACLFLHHFFLLIFFLMVLATSAHYAPTPTPTLWYQLQRTDRKRTNVITFKTKYVCCS